MQKMGVSWNGATPKWMVYGWFIGQNPVTMDDLGTQHPYFRKRLDYGMIVVLGQLLYCWRYMLWHLQPCQHNPFLVNDQFFFSHKYPGQRGLFLLC